MRTSDFESNPIFSLTIEDGITPKTDRYERTSLITKTEDLFKIVSPNEFVTNPMDNARILAHFRIPALT